MKVFQLLVAQSPDNMSGYSREEYRDDLLTPNPLFLSLKGIKDHVFGDVNEVRTDLGLAPLPWLDWLDMLASDDEVSEPRLRYIDEETGLIYDIVEVEVQP